jgi:diguanylate cyclase (GGDEF)-like protein
MATTDGLTGLFNRRFLDNSLRAEYDRAKRYGTQLSVMMFDVDHFKRFNDEHGHDMGDLVLKVLGQALKDALRTHDLPCRYGGEEFVAILPNTNKPGAYCVAERFRKDVEELEIEGLHVTVSIGIATFPDLPMESAEQLIETADKALYASKHAGRNRVTVAEEA